VTISQTGSRARVIVTLHPMNHAKGRNGSAEHHCRSDLGSRAPAILLGAAVAGLIGRGYRRGGLLESSHVNPLPLVYWFLAASLIGLVPWLALGWSFWASLGAGMLAAPPLGWALGALIDRRESSGSEEPSVTGRAPLVLETAPACPRCGSAGSAEILYGLPALTDELKQALAEHKVVLGGCPVYAGAPRWLCLKCREKHGLLVLVGG
jgi:hypothetical protein